MMNASQMSARIRAKKKLMEDQNEAAVSLSGIPEDLTDHAVIKDKEYGEMLSENTPKEHDETPTADAEMAQEREAQPTSEPEDPHQVNQPSDAARETRMARLRSQLMSVASQITQTNSDGMGTTSQGGEEMDEKSTRKMRLRKSMGLMST